MARAEIAKTEVEPEERFLPPPLPDGSEHLESLGRWVDNLFGDARIHRAVDQELDRITLTDQDVPEDPPPAEPPAPLPDGSEVITRGGEPPGKT
jgi:hypothetical protein